MIIKSKGTKGDGERGEKGPSEGRASSSKNIIKAEAVKKGTSLKKMREEKLAKNEEKPVEIKEPEPPKKSEIELKVDEYEKIDVTSLDFKERFERRRGERRRGFRRIDERTLVSRAQEEAQNIRAIAAREGYKNGLAEAKSEIDMLKTSLQEFVAVKNRVYDEIAKDVLEIALAVAKKIIKKEVELSGEVLKSVMSEVFCELSSGEEKVVVKVNPEDVEFAKVSLPEILADSPIDAKIIVNGDELVERGSCTVIASNGVVDANFTTQLSIIQTAFDIYKGGE